MEARRRENHGEVDLIVVQNSPHVLVDRHGQFSFPSIASRRGYIGQGHKLHIGTGAYLGQVIVFENPAEADDTHAELRHVRPG